MEQLRIYRFDAWENADKIAEFLVANGVTIQDKKEENPMRNIQNMKLLNGMIRPAENRGVTLLLSSAGILKSRVGCLNLSERDSLTITKTAYANLSQCF